MNYKHGYAKTKLENTYYNMLSRCNNPKDRDFVWYGMRGIKVCSEWKDNKISFFNWAISNGYSDELTLDRIDSNRNYEPSNCRWVTAKVQSNNRRNNHFVRAYGKTMTIAEWSDQTGIKPATIQARLQRGWNEEDAVTMEVVGNGWNCRGNHHMVVHSRQGQGL